MTEIVVNWTYEGQYSKSFSSAEKFVEYFQLEEYFPEDSDPSTWTMEKAADAFNRALDHMPGMIPDQLSEMSDDSHWHAGEVDMDRAEADVFTPKEKA